MIDTTIFGSFILNPLSDFSNGAFSVLFVFIENLLPGYSLVLKELLFLLNTALFKLFTLLFKLLLPLDCSINTGSLVVLECL